MTIPDTLTEQGCYRNVATILEYWAKRTPHLPRVWVERQDIGEQSVIHGRSLPVVRSDMVGGLPRAATFPLVR